jgi:EAL domain-containing protein (putative c-di-GMP-specific phosphodiesterase class I)
MAHKLGLKVVAEGVETELQRDLLRQISCDYAQGFLFSRAVPASEFETLRPDSGPSEHHSLPESLS